MEAREDPETKAGKARANTEVANQTKGRQDPRKDVTIVEALTTRVTAQTLEKDNPVAKCLPSVPSER